MARIGGRSLWLAWPIGLIAFAVVAGLAWLAYPMTPVVVAWAQGAVAGTLGPGPAPTVSVPPESPAAGEESGGAGEAIEVERAGPPGTCEELYPPSNWQQLTSSAGLALQEGATAPQTAVTDLADALGASVLVSCAWTDASGAATVTLSRVAPVAATTVAGVLGGAGFECQQVTDGVACAKPAGEDDRAEEHVVRGDLWLATVRTLPGPPVPQDAIESRIWP
ncbi:hypothetical protein RYJ27_11605 [Microbacterium limosum]|uniref:Uncharacterized protein n=1 Tax=Microbacterium limosum TaxID=3079935 RepID=A0AAU0MGL8_9MICO|nr:hypothetical protein [Microbacterium sp. Y20]WOQ69330.1 hypothetical protein RYJ27_11605 [Microbacterium sp. Y20]